MLRRGLAAAAGLAAGPFLSLGRIAWGTPALAVSTRAVELVARATVIDMLGLVTMDWPKLRHWQRKPGLFGAADYRRLETTGIDVFHPSVDLGALDAYPAARSWLADWNRLIEGRACFLRRAERGADLTSRRDSGRFAIVLGLQDSTHFRSAADVEEFFLLGQRVSQLTYNERNRLGSGCWVAHDRGLTELGAAVVAAMNRVGMAIDVSHCGERTSLEALRSSRAPVLVTHANCRALVPGQRRNKSDAVIRALAAGGGVMGITLVRGFVGRGLPGLDDVLDHFDHVARLVGVEHVGLGSDLAADALDELTGEPLPPYRIDGLRLDARALQIADGLLRRGYSEEDVGAMLGGNFQRALTSIWPPAPAADDAAVGRDPFCPAPRRAAAGGGVEAGVSAAGVSAAGVNRARSGR